MARAELGNRQMAGAVVLAVTGESRLKLRRWGRVGFKGRRWVRVGMKGQRWVRVGMKGQRWVRVDEGDVE